MVVHQLSWQLPRVTSLPVARRLPISLNPHDTCFLVVIVAVLMGVRCVSLTVSDTEHVFTCLRLLAVCAPPWEQCLSKAFALEMACFCLEFPFSCVLDPGPLSEVIAEVFFRCVCCLLTFSMVSFEAQMF